MNKARIVIAIASVVIPSLLIVSCNKSEEKQETNVAPISIVRIDKMMDSISRTTSDTIEIPDSLREELGLLARICGYGKGTVTDIRMMLMSPATKVFAPMTVEAFANTDTLERSLGQVRARAIEEGVSLPNYRYYGVVWGKPLSVVTSDSVLFVALNHYLGRDNEVYNGMPDYMRNMKNADRLIIDITEAEIGINYPVDNEDETMTVLSRMLSEGGRMCVVERLTGCEDTGLLLGYTPSEMEWLEAHEKEMYEMMAKKKLLYETDYMTKTRLFDASPSTSILSAESPGRVGRYLGYKIVKQWLEKYPETALSELLSKDYYGRSERLQESGYRP